MDNITTATAGAALVSPWWLPALDNIHTVASWLLPVAGLAWIGMQMYYKYKEKNPK